MALFTSFVYQGNKLKGSNVSGGGGQVERGTGTDVVWRKWLILLKRDMARGKEAKDEAKRESERQEEASLSTGQKQGEQGRHWGRERDGERYVLLAAFYKASFDQGQVSKGKRRGVGGRTRNREQETRGLFRGVDGMPSQSQCIQRRWHQTRLAGMDR